MSYVFTNEKCSGCNKCVRECPVLLSNVATTPGVVHVDPYMCISCGACFDACTHNARDYKDDTESFFDALKKARRKYRSFWHRRFLQIIQRSISGF